MKQSLKFGQKVFLDEYVWGSADELLKKINNNQRIEKGNKKYEYILSCLIIYLNFFTGWLR